MARPLRCSINITLDGCCDHTAGYQDAETHAYATDWLRRCDALLLGRVTYGMMEDGWRRPAAPGERPDWAEPFAAEIGPMQKYVVSSKLESVDWNAELVRGDLAEAVSELKAQPGTGIGVGGVQLPLALAQLGLIDEYEFVVHPVIAGHGPTLLSGLSEHVRLKLVHRHEFSAGAVALRYVPA